jgi:hypothetical protein
MRPQPWLTKQSLHNLLFMKAFFLLLVEENIETVLGLISKLSTPRQDEKTYHFTENLYEDVKMFDNPSEQRHILLKTRGEH